MIGFNVIWLISLVLLVLAFFGLIIVSKLFYSPIDSNKAIFSRIFPFELVNHIGKGFSFYRIILFVFAAVCFSPIFIFVGNLGMYENFRIFGIVISCLFGLSGILFTFLHFFNPNNVKVHIYLLISFIATTLLSGLLTFSFSFNIMKVNNLSGVGSVPTIIFGGLSIVPMLLILVFSFSGKLSNWAKLEKDNVGYKRPSVFPLALLEWATALALFIEEISFFFVLLKI